MSVTFYNAIIGKGKLSVIAEIKKRSPSHGFFPNHDEKNLVHIYETGGAKAISVVTEKEVFGGSLELLERIASRSKLPVLRKDFLQTEKDIDETHAAGASAVLLIMQNLSEMLTVRLTYRALEKNLTPLLEIHDEKDLEKALLMRNVDGIMYGINNRNLQTLRVNAAHALLLLSKIPAQKPIIIESGMQSIKDIASYMGKADGILVGTAFLTATDPLKTLQSFTSCMA